MEDNIMNEELKNQLAIFIGKALEVAEKGINTAGDQIPALLQEIVYREFITAGVLLLLACLLFVLTIFFYCIYRMNIEEEDPLSGILALFSGAGTLFFASMAVITFLEAWWAPRLVIIDYLKGLL